MINLLEISDDQLNQTMQLLKVEFIKRGWTAELPYIGSAHCFIDRHDGSEVMHIFSATPPTTTFAAAHLANDKYATYQRLLQYRVPQLETLLIRDFEDLTPAHDFMGRYDRVVVKPIDGGHGKGITVNVDTVERMTRALDVARQNSKSRDAVLMQQQYIHPSIHDLRLLCIDYTFVAAIERVAARVYGDGVQSVQQLVEQENLSSRRGRPYYAQLATIDIALVETYLGVEGLARIPEAGEEVTVLGIANYGAGGETVDITDQIPDWMKQEAEAAARACELPVTGVDFMTSQTPDLQATREDLDAVIIEINKCPALMMHDRPTSGESRHVVTAYVDYLAKL